ncbi:MAG: NAD(P)-dependent oxidoreductase [Acidobacteriota bacterium]
MKTLVTGGAGYFGSVVVRRLLAAGHEVCVLDSLERGGEALLSLWHHPGFRFVHGDVRAAQRVEEALEGVDAVAHLAAVVGAPACARDPQRARSVNVEGSRVVYEAAAARGVERFVFASTCTRFGFAAGLDESSEVAKDPLALYARTKSEVEQELLTPRAGAPATTVLRFATFFGLSPKMRFDLTVNGYTRELLRRRKLIVYGGHTWRPYLHVSDAATALDTALSAELATVRSRVFNVGDERMRVRKERVAELVAQSMPHEVEIEAVERDVDAREHGLSFRRFRRALGFRPEHTLRQGIAEVRDALQQGVFGVEETRPAVAA